MHEQHRGELACEAQRTQFEDANALCMKQTPHPPHQRRAACCLLRSGKPAAYILQLCAAAPVRARRAWPGRRQATGQPCARARHSRMRCANAACACAAVVPAVNRSPPRVHPKPACGYLTIGATPPASPPGARSSKKGCDIATRADTRLLGSYTSICCAAQAREAQRLHGRCTDRAHAPPAGRSPRHTASARRRSTPAGGMGRAHISAQRRTQQPHSARTRLARPLRERVLEVRQLRHPRP